jgi:hypothetical protein
MSSWLRTSARISLMRLSSASLAASRVLRSAARDVRSLRSRSSLPLISSFSYSSCSLPSTVSSRMEMTLKRRSRSTCSFVQAST